jgi:DNA-binding transcriptional MerR regulator
MQERFSSQEVARRTGITPRQLQWWDERGVVRPDREGRRRLYTVEQLTEIAVISELRRKGFSLQSVRKVMRFLGREFDRRLAQVAATSSELHLLSDGNHLYVETEARQIVDILKNSNQPILSVCLSEAARRVRAGVVAGKGNTSVTSPNCSQRVRKVS